MCLKQQQKLGISQNGYAQISYNLTINPEAKARR